MKALLVKHEILFPWTHSIARLIELIEESITEVPESIKESIPLTEYAVTARYPGAYEDVIEEEYTGCLEIAKRVLQWVEKELRESKGG